MKNRTYLALDFGAGSGRSILGRFDGTTVTVEEISRFPNYFVDLNGTYYWDVVQLFHQTKAALRACNESLAGEKLSVIGIDTWGTDYGLIDRGGQLLGNVRCMRNADGKISAEVAEKVGAEELFNHTGMQMLYGNTLFQLYEQVKNNDPAIVNAEHMLMLPDLLGYFLTGRRGTEYTIASTSMLINPQTCAWDIDLAEKVGIPGRIFSPILTAGKGNRFELLSEVQQETGCTSLSYFPVATHDTASAVAACPLRKGEAFCSSGTWSLLGILIDKPVLTKACRLANFSNEGAVDGRIRLLKNIMGMWLLQQCMQQWNAAGSNLSWNAVVELAAAAKRFRSFINAEEADFYHSGDMIGRIRNYCRRTGQPVPESVGEIALCIFESIAMRYRYTIETLEKITGHRINALRIVGGGGQNALLNQCAANALGRPVHTGAVEAASIGNILVQAVADGELDGTDAIGEVVERSFPGQTFLPHDEARWTGEFERYLELIAPYDS